MELDQSGLSCPRCGDRLEDDVATAVAIAIEELQEEIVAEPRLPIRCPACGVLLELVAGGVYPSLLGGELWIEDRRETVSMVRTRGDHLWSDSSHGPGSSMK